MKDILVTTSSVILDSLLILLRWS